MRVTLSVAAARKARFAKRSNHALAMSGAVSPARWHVSYRRYLAYTAILQAGF